MNNCTAITKPLTAIPVNVGACAASAPVVLHIDKTSMDFKNLPATSEMKI
ncbi:hypothetical protein TG4357_00754 [Thalassovita gelatinovora]|uniref:Uncharacterized protein n=1 Tax=Thalassovita gelatinovora TaxID=53501 RepID=A0A0P1F6U0_THAGE|nr:hypothetical protein [Thalassovita gelatinovora]QIZ80999.1 hypothetical protein HFZ77_11225 [Thalassovita gelatinovora]CUH63547.1 hypothetical protein TG4357_00754 [Thalassovita gelatinovora]SEQ69049.1 hypothetical protein SAMN04488043_107258 [Thalassovita gelatinovora]